MDHCSLAQGTPHTGKHINKTPKKFSLTDIVLRTDGARRARLAEVLGRGSDRVAAVAPDPAVGQQIGQRIDPAGGAIDARVARVLVLEVGQIGAVVLLLGDRHDVVGRRAEIVDLRDEGHEVEALAGRVDVARVEDRHVGLPAETRARIGL